MGASCARRAAESGFAGGVTSVAFMLGSGGTILLAVAGGLGWNLFIRPPEEEFLVHLFGPEHERYRQAVRCWIPRWPPFPLVPPGHLDAPVDGSPGVG